MIALPGQLFYTTQIPVCLWFLSKSKGEDKKRGFRNRKGETLFIDARHKGALIDRTHRELSTEEITEIARTYHAWRGAPQPPKGGVASQPPKGGASSTSTEESAITTSPLGERGAWDYKDIPGFCKSATLEEMKSHHYVLTPGRYVGAAEVEDDLPAPRPGTFVVYAIR
jgi:type I restriction enzyme M protein